jgi:hypothetical protein
MEGFKPNRRELEKDSTAQQALGRMDQILAAKSPYGLIKEVEGLVAAVRTVNEDLLKKQKDYYVRSVDEKIGKVSEMLEQYNADADLKNKALKPLQDIKKRIEDENSIPGIVYHAKEAEEALENSIDVVETAQDKAGKTPTIPVKYVQPSKIATKHYLETEDDIEQFLQALRKELEAALRDKARIRIR